MEMSHNIRTQVMDEDKYFIYKKKQTVILPQFTVNIRESVLLFMWCRSHSDIPTIKVLKH